MRKIMKIRMKRDVLVEVYKPKLDETWDVTLRKWQELNVETLNPAFLETYDGDTYYGLPEDAYEVVK
jgi:hypothetical protein